jgi:hypothetical protein
VSLQRFYICEDIVTIYSSIKKNTRTFYHCNFLQFAVSTQGRHNCAETNPLTLGNVWYFRRVAVKCQDKYCGLIKRRKIVKIVKCGMFRLAGNVASMKNSVYIKKFFLPWLISNLMHKILIYLHIIHLLKSSTCFEHYPAHLQEIYDVIMYVYIYIYIYIYTHSFVIVTLCRWLSCAPVKKELYMFRALPCSSSGDLRRNYIYTQFCYRYYL